MISMRSLSALILAAALLGGCGREPEPLTEPRQQGESPFQYPEELWDAGVQGRTTLRLFINPQGRVDTVRVEQSSGHGAFDSAALAGARLLRFDPARRGEQPIAVWRSLPVEFNLGTAADSAAGRTQTRPTP
jgi:periplasmic protein TonB